TRNVMWVVGSFRRSPPIVMMSPGVVDPACSRLCITEPAQRNRHALKNAWVPRWKIAAVQLPVPAATNMNPSWLTVEYASTFFMSVWANAMNAAISAVRSPMVATTISAVVDDAYRSDSRHTMYTPAVTIVAAWISAETGVGPAIASGSHTNSGSCADLPHAPMNNRIPAAAASRSPPRKLWTYAGPMLGSLRLAKSRLPRDASATATSFVAPNNRNIPSKKQKSPMRLTMNALRPAVANASLSYQNPISRYEHRPTPSQPMNITGRFAASTRINIDPVNRLR